MPSKPFRNAKIFFDSESFVQIVIFEVNPPVRGSEHNYKYRMAYVQDGVCLLRYDNEAGKGDHKHIGDQEIPTTFTSIEQLVTEFFDDIEQIRR